MKLQKTTVWRARPGNCNVFTVSASKTKERKHIVKLSVQLYVAHCEWPLLAD